MYLKHYIPFQAMKDVRSHIYLLCNVILFVGGKTCVASSTVNDYMMGPLSDSCFVVSFSY